MESEECFPPDTGRVLDVLSFIKDHVLPFDALKILLILGDLGIVGVRGEPRLLKYTHQLIARNEDMEWRILVIADLLLAPKFP